MSKSQNRKNSFTLRVTLMCIVAIILIIIFIVAALIIAPKAHIPEIEISDQNGEWKAQGEIAVFDDKINPGSEGTYQFIIKNKSDKKLKYTFNLTERIGNKENATPFIQYRLKVDNIPIDEQWNYVGLDYNDIKILPGSKHYITLEWRWPFENDNDTNDTLIGRSEGQLSVWLFLDAEVEYD